jgi:purine-cytosine permease-like protein
MAPEEEQRGGLSGELETVGVAPVPDSERTITPPRLFILWAMASASALTPIIGFQLYEFGLWWMIAAIVLAWVLAFVPAGLFSEMGREIPLSALIVARRTYGYAGAAIFAILFTAVNAGFFGLNTAVGGELLGALAHTSATPWTWLIGAAQTVLVLFGMRWLEPFYRWTSILFIVCYGALVVYLFAHFDVHLPHSEGHLEWGPALTTILSISILAWTYKLSTVSRFAVPAGKEKRGRASYFLAPSVGIMGAVLILAVVGMFSQQATGEWNVALLGAELSGWGTVAGIGVVVAIVHTNAMNLYPSTVDVLVAINSFFEPRKWEQPIGTALLGLFSTVLAVAGILTHIESFLNGIGDVIFPFTFLMLADWFIVQRRRVETEDLFERPRTVSGWIVPASAIAFCIGLAFNLWADNLLPSWFNEQLPLPLVGALLSTLIYLGLTVWPAHLAVRGGGTASTAAPEQPAVG